MTTITLPKKAVRDIFEASKRFATAQDALEDALLAYDPTFLKKMRGLRDAHQEQRFSDWSALKDKHGL